MTHTHRAPARPVGWRPKPPSLQVRVAQLKGQAASFVADAGLLNSTTRP
jgi:hypothetical protein